MALVENRQRGFVLNHYHGEYGYEASLLTKDSISFANFAMNNSGVITPQLLNSADPLQVMKLHGGSSFKTVPLKELSRLEWFSDDPQLDFYSTNPATGKTQREFVRFDSLELRQKYVNYVGACRPGGKSSEGKQSIWRIGTTQFLFSGIALLVIGGMGIAMFFVKKTNKPAEGGGALLEALGPWGVLGVCAATIAGLMIWWFIECQKPYRKWMLEYAPKG